MAARGSYAKGIAKRQEILDTALEVIAKRGYHRTTIKDLAEAVGLSQTGLLHHFGTKEDLFVEILRTRDAASTSSAEAQFAEGAPVGSDDLARGLVDVGRINSAVPGLVQLYAQFSTAATEEGHPARAYFQERYAQYRQKVSEAIRAQQRAGDLPEALDPDRAATLIAAATDGLQTQWMLDESIDMAEHIDHLWRALIAAARSEPTPKS